MCGCLLRAPTGDLAHNPGVCPDWELNQRPFCLQAGTQSAEPYQPGLCAKIFDGLENTAFLLGEKVLECERNYNYTWPTVYHIVGPALNQAVC